jgi:hypothetical protein
MCANPAPGKRADADDSQNAVRDQVRPMAPPVATRKQPWIALVMQSGPRPMPDDTKRVLQHGLRVLIRTTRLQLRTTNTGPERRSASVRDCDCWDQPQCVEAHPTVATMTYPDLSHLPVGRGYLEPRFRTLRGIRIHAHGVMAWSARLGEGGSTTGVPKAGSDGPQTSTNKPQSCDVSGTW